MKKHNGSVNLGTKLRAANLDGYGDGGSKETTRGTLENSCLSENGDRDLMNDARQKSLLIQGLLFSLVPALLLYPALAFLVICPPEYAPALWMTFSSVIGGSEITALWKLVPILKGSVGWTTCAAVLGLVVALPVFILACFGLFIGVNP